MAKVQRTYKKIRDKQTGKMVDFIDPKTKKRMPTGKWRIRFDHHDGKRKWVTLAYRGKSENEAQKEADLREAREREIKAGLRPIPRPEPKAKGLSYIEAVEKYIASGKTNGGRRKHPWSDKHVKDTQSMLAWWGEVLNLDRLTDAIGCLPRVEEILSKIKEIGRPPKGPNQKVGKRTGKTLQNLQSTLSGLFKWCSVPTRGFLPSNPLDGIMGFNTDPVRIRRSLTPEEIMALFTVATLAQWTLLETSLLSGLRQMELRELKEDDFDPVGMTLHIKAVNDKGRKERFQVIPERLVKMLAAFIDSGEAKRLYKKFYTRKDSTAVIPSAPLLFVPSHTARLIKELAAKAWVPICTTEGKIDFHALRTTYIDHLVPITDPKSTQTLARHEGIKTTMDVYARAHDDRLRAAVDSLAQKLMPADKWPIYGQSEKSRENKIATTFYGIGGCGVQDMVEAAGIEPASCDKFGGSRSVRSR